MASFKLEEKKSKVFVYTLDYCFFKDEENNTLSCYNKKFELLWCVYDDHGIEYKRYKDFVFAIGHDKFSILNVADGKEISSHPYVPIGWNNEFIISKDRKNFPPVLRCDKLVSNQFIEVWVKEDYSLVYLYYSDNKNIYFINKDRITTEVNYGEIISLDISSGKESWRFNTSIFGENLSISRILGVSKGILILGFGDKYIIGLDVVTGKIVWHMLGFAQFDELEEEKGILHSFTRSHCSFDIRTGIAVSQLKGEEMLKEEEMFNRHNFTSQRNKYIVTDTHIISTDWRKGKIIAYNMATHEFDWIWEEAGLFFQYYPMRYFDPYLFVNDQNMNLYVFKKQL
ncbi:MAG: hypothetical protein LBL13_01630 [Bacteroidales bacterium]|jgi:hypothetical protein|nr:hypothetical protein [Bacteroidales bacterium]